MSSCMKSLKKMSLSEDMLIEIFARLPAKSLHRLKCVSKEWHNLISRGVLSRKILPPLLSGLFYQNLEQSGYASVSNSKVVNSGDMDTSLSFLPCHQKFRIANCCNGLLLGWMRDYHVIPKLRHYIVCNPATKKCVSLYKVDRIHYVAGLVYDPRISNHFKVVRFLGSSRGASFVDLDIFSSETGKWVESTVSLRSEGTLLFGGQAVYSNGALHVLFYLFDVLRFDIKEESCELIELPEAANRVTFGCIGECGGCLHYADFNAYRMEIWALRDYQSNEWELKHCIRMQDLVKQLPEPDWPDWRCFHLIAFHPDTEVLFLQMKGKILSYHLNSSKLENFWTTTQTNAALKFFTCPFSPSIDKFSL
ncbi:F-box protein At5g07610-like isoform X1 [Tasmannia lanceolata]|uniref:F-box protein At5g07610-like isoform X1 n=1 Tax=Tasmannia lanceolata TaxID=3420 RepID=UPI004062E357